MNIAPKNLNVMYDYFSEMHFPSSDHYSYISIALFFMKYFQLISASKYEAPDCEKISLTTTNSFPYIIGNKRHGWNLFVISISNECKRKWYYTGENISFIYSLFIYLFYHYFLLFYFQKTIILKHPYTLKTIKIYLSTY